jgi:hypothetical protein
MAIPNTTYYESLVTATTVVRERHVDADGLVHAPTGPGIALPLDYGYGYGAELQQFIERPAA